MLGIIDAPSSGGRGGGDVAASCGSGLTTSHRRYICGSTSRSFVETRGEGLPSPVRVGSWIALGKPEEEPA